MPESSVRPSEIAIQIFCGRFGVDPDFVQGLRFHERPGEIWAARALPPAGIFSQRSPGLRALRQMPDGFKPTSAFLMLLNDRITLARIELDRTALHALLMGRSIEGDWADGYVALSFRGDVIGCGRARRGALKSQIPTGRRHELLSSLEVCRADESPEM